MMIGNVQCVIDTMNALKGLGVKGALDDFGTGYSSLNYLRQFPIDALQIEQRFVRDISSHEGAAGICRAIIHSGISSERPCLPRAWKQPPRWDICAAAIAGASGILFQQTATAAQALTLLDHRYCIG